MSALEIAIGVTIVIAMCLVAMIIAASTPDELRGRSMSRFGWLMLACTFGTVWFVARLWGFA